MSGGREEYYLGLAREDYFQHGGEPPGYWLGRYGRGLNLPDPIEGEHLRRLMRGHHPMEDRSLVQEHANRRAGWDLTFSAPKSVSVLWGTADDRVRKQIQKAQHHAVARVSEWLERDIVRTRRSHGGKKKERAELVIAAYPHYTSRAQDPQVHTHLLLLNVCQRRDGSTGTLEPKTLYKRQEALDQLYKAELSHQLQRRLGVAVYLTPHGFEIEGVPRELCQALSKRRATILKQMEAEGVRDPASRERIALQTRSVKDHVAIDLLREGWREQARAHAFEPAAVLQRIDRPDATLVVPPASWDQQKPIEVPSVPAMQSDGSAAVLPPVPMVDLTAPLSPRSAQDSVLSHASLPKVASWEAEVAKIAGELDIQRSQAGRKSSPEEQREKLLDEATRTFGEHELAVRSKAKNADITRRVSAWSLPYGYSAREIQRSIQRFWNAHIAGRDEQKQGGQDRHELRREVDQYLKDLQILRERKGHPVSQSGSPQRSGLQPKHRPARDPRDLTLVHAPLGVSATRELRQYRRLWEQSGYKVIAVTRTAHAAAKIEHETGVRAITAAGLSFHSSGPRWRPRHWERLGVLLDRDAPLATKLDLLKNPDRAPRPRADKAFQVNRKTVLVQVESHAMAFADQRTLAQLAVKRGAKLVQFGDGEAPQAIRGRAAFRNTIANFASTNLNREFRNESERPETRALHAALSRFASGELDAGREALGREKLIRFGEGYRNSIAALIQEYRRNRTADPSQTLAITSDTASAREVNRRVQTFRQEAKEVGWMLKQRIHGSWAYKGDRVRFTATVPPIGYRSGEFGTVVGVGLNDTLKVRLDRPRSLIGLPMPSKVVTVPAARLGDLRLGYAIPLGQASGVEVERVLALQSPSRSGPAHAYMQLSRAKERGILIVTESHDAAEHERLLRPGNEKRQHVLLPPPEPPIPQPAQYQAVGISR